MRARGEILFWGLILAIGAVATYEIRRIDSAFAVAKPEARPSTLAELVERARVGNSSFGPASQEALSLATQLRAPDSISVALKPTGEAAPRAVDTSLVVASISSSDGAARKLRAAMEQSLPRAAGALAALTAATGALRSAGAPQASAYGELAPYPFAERRLTILQLGDSHTAADFFSGRVRARLQEAFGEGGETFIVPGRPHVGVRSSLFATDATSDWTYEALQRNDDRSRLHLSGFNAVARHATATLTFKSRDGRPYDDAAISFLNQPNGGKAEVLLDGKSAGEVDLDGGANHEVTFEARLSRGGEFRELEVRTLDDAPVAVTGLEFGREGDGVSYLSIGYPGATVQLLQKLDSGNFADDIRRLAPDIVVLAFGTNEGFNDNLDVNAYISQYAEIVRRLQAIRPGLRIVLVGPADAARPTGQCHAEGVGQKCKSAPVVQTAAFETADKCRLPIPPKLNLVREAQRKLAAKIGAAFWDWSSVQGGVCGAQVWAAANPPLMAHDYVHMTLEGYKQSADRFADFLIPLIQGRPAATHVVSNN